MSIEPSSTDQNVARALRANLQGVQRQSEELHQAIADLVAACSSNRPANALPHLLRAEANAASLAAVLEVLAKFVAGSSSSQPARRAEDQLEASENHRGIEPPAERSTSISAALVEPAPKPEIVAAAIPAPAADSHVHKRVEAPPQAEIQAHEPAPATVEAAEVSSQSVAETPAEQSNSQEQPAPDSHAVPKWEMVPTAHASEHAIEDQPAAQFEESAPEPIQASAAAEPAPAESREPLPIEAFASAPASDASSGEIEVIDDSSPDHGENGHIAEGSIAEAMGFAATQPASDASLEQSEVFDIAALPAEQQEMHRRANRVAKVSMQDIQLLRPDLVQQGRVGKDICIRLKDEIEKARREYERRFRPILGQGADYFYFWMVEVLGAGDAETLGEYPYHAPVLRH